MAEEVWKQRVAPPVLFVSVEDNRFASDLMGLQLSHISHKPSAKQFLSGSRDYMRDWLFSSTPTSTQEEQIQVGFATFCKFIAWVRHILWLLQPVI